MQTYNYLSNEMPRELIEVYNDMQQDLLRIVVKRLKQGESPDKVFQEIQDKVASYDSKTQRVLEVIFADSKKKNVKDNERVFKEEPDEHKQAVTNNEANSLIAPAIVGAMAVLSQLNKKIINNTMRRYTSDYMYIKSPYGDGLTKLKQTYKGLAKTGITILESFRGGREKSYAIENVLRRDVMFKVNQANAKVNKENFNKSSAKFIEVSSHPTARTWNKYMTQPYEDHSSWQGKVYYSRDGEAVAGYEEFESTCGYGELLGICGINCYHQFQMNYTGDTNAKQYSDKEVEKNYALSQEQRRLERMLRQAKQQQAVFEEAGDQNLLKQAKQNVSILHSQLKDFCERHNLKYYNWRTQI